METNVVREHHAPQLARSKQKLFIAFFIRAIFLSCQDINSAQAQLLRDGAGTCTSM